ncbi:LANO_0D04060g1_1 [Lachancea nothofagi CBS 11611]|uniref:Peroxisome assembly protein 12 n=1 Tax=Lachancea nothofagi CBS 11611 TaxID=1266666 RepID=A0A1G4JGL5_9SACH|nr:LANO_0D04060g1_1 [Lachancea nothofagi CBS 11611]
MDFYSNLSSTSSPLASSIYPTIFEILSSDEIDALLTPSVRYITANLVARKPNKYTLWINNWFDEWFLLATKLAIESHYVINWDGTFIENFYGLKRINSSNSVLLKTLQRGSNLDIPLRLNTNQRCAVLFEKVLVPYLATKLDLTHSKLLAGALVRDRLQDEGTSFRIRKALRGIFVKYYPLLKKLVFLLNLAVKLYFLSGRTGATSLIDFILNIQYTRLSRFDYERNEDKKLDVLKGHGLSRPSKLNKSALLFLLKVWSSKFGSTIKTSASQFFPAFIFTLRVFQWWTSQDLSAELLRKVDAIDGDIPPPPFPFERNISGKCRICDNPIQNPAAIGTGYVFCYPCIMAYLPQHEGKCPVTGSKLLGCDYDKESGNWSVKGVRKLLV